MHQNIVLSLKSGNNHGYANHGIGANYIKHTACKYGKPGKSQADPYI